MVSFCLTQKAGILLSILAGMAMVPFADLFNHKAAVVQLGSGYFVEDVCFEGQGSSESEGDRSDDDAEEDLGSQDSDENQDPNEV